MTAELQTGPDALLIPEHLPLMCSKPDEPSPLASGEAAEVKDAAKAPPSKHSGDNPSPKVEVHSPALHICHLGSLLTPDQPISLKPFTNSAASHTCEA